MKAFQQMRPIGLTSFILSAIAVVNPIQAFAQQRGYGDWHMGPWMMGYGGGGWWSMLMMILMWTLIIAGIVAVVRWLFGWNKKGCQPHSGDSHSAIEILQERYARGEITRDEFLNIKKDF